MPDIFGRSPQDYNVIRAWEEMGLWEARQELVASLVPHAAPRHDFEALGRVPDHLARQENNAQVTGYVTNSLQAVQTMIAETLYLNYRLPDYIPINTGMPEGAASYLVRILDRVGKGQFITNYGTDAPTASVSQRTQTQILRYAGIDGLWSVEDVRSSMMSGIPLS